MRSGYVPQSDSVHSFDFSTFLVGERESFVVYSVGHSNVFFFFLVRCLWSQNQREYLCSFDPNAVLHDDEADAQSSHPYRAMDSVDRSLEFYRFVESLHAGLWALHL